eukprot:5258066-Pyramimonas_sp.AAC.1
MAPRGEDKDKDYSQEGEPLMFCAHPSLFSNATCRINDFSARPATSLSYYSRAPRSSRSPLSTLPTSDSINSISTGHHQRQGGSGSAEDAENGRRYSTRLKKQGDAPPRLPSSPLREQDRSTVGWVPDASSDSKGAKKRPRGHAHVKVGAGGRRVISSSTAAGRATRECQNDERGCSKQWTTIIGDVANCERRANCVLAEVRANGWVFMFVVTIKTLQVGEEFLLDYSDEYWEHSEHMDAVHQEIRFALF